MKSNTILKKCQIDLSKYYNFLIQVFCQTLQNLSFEIQTPTSEHPSLKREYIHRSIIFLSKKKEKEKAPKCALSIVIMSILNKKWHYYKISLFFN